MSTHTPILTNQNLISESGNGNDAPINLFPKIYLSGDDRQAIHIASMACSHMLCGSPAISTFNPVELERAFSRLIQLYVFAQPMERKATTVTVELTHDQIGLAFAGCRIMAERMKPGDPDTLQFAELAEIFGKAYWGDDNE